MRPYQKTSALLLALLWVGMPMAAVVHASLEQHSYCAEHKVLEHTQADSETEGRHQSSDQSTDQSSDQSTDQSSDQDSTVQSELPADHDECFVTDDCITGSGLLADDALASAAPPDARQDVARLENLIDAAAIPLLLAAPKNSPPSRLV